MNSKELRKKLDKENKNTVRIFKCDMKKKKGLSPECMASWKRAIAAWHEWREALDIVE